MSAQTRAAKSILDQRSSSLIEEFTDHAVSYQTRFGESPRSEIFEGWALQKIAGLQLALELIQSQLDELKRGRGAA